MELEIWSDVICPWCYIGKRRVEDALARFEHADQVNITWRSFELDPGAPPERRGSLTQHLAVKYGMSVEQAQASVDRLTRLADADGLEYHLDATRAGSTFDAHRLIHFAAERGKQDAVKERFLAAYFTEGQPIGDHDTLARLAVEAGLDADEVRAVLDGDAYAADVRADEERAHDIGVTGVPFFLLAGRFAVPGAQDADTMLDAIRRAWNVTHATADV